MNDTRFNPPNPPYQKKCLTCEYVILAQNRQGKFVGARCSHPHGVKRVVDILYSCPHWSTAGGYYEIETLVSSDETGDFVEFPKPDEELDLHDI